MLRRCLLFVALFVCGFSSAFAQDTGCPANIPSEGVSRCVSLFDTSAVTITSMHGEQALFLNPQVTVSLSVKGVDGEIVRVYVPSGPDWYEITPLDGKCSLVVVGIGNAPNDTTSSLLYEDLPANSASLTRGLFTFCARSSYTNILRDPRISDDAVVDFGFSVGDFKTDGFTRREDFPAALQAVISRAYNGTVCSGSSGALTWESFVTQLAVFIALNPNPTPYTTWRLYAREMQNIGFLQDYAGIYCLLNADAPQPEAVLWADKTEGIVPLSVAFSNRSTGDSQGYAFDIFNAQNTPMYSATRAAFPAATLEPYQFEQTGNYHARLTVFGPTQSYLSGTVIPQPVSTTVVEIQVSEPPPMVIQLVTGTPEPTATQTEVPPIERVMNDHPFANAPELTGQNALLLFAGVIIGAVVVFVLLSAEMRSILLHNRRLLIVLMAAALVVLGVVLWSQRAFSNPAEASPIPESRPNLMTAEPTLEATMLPLATTERVPALTPSGGQAVATPSS